MNKYSKQLAVLTLTAALGAGALPLAAQPAAAAPLTAQAIQEAVDRLADLKVMNGYEDGSIRENNPITRAELAKLVSLAFGIQGGSELGFADVKPQAWYAGYAAGVVEQQIMDATDGRFQPQAIVTDDELLQTVTKALKRDAKSVSYWARDFYAQGSSATRGETAYLLANAHEAIPAADARITNVSVLNAITLIVTFDKPLTADNEAFAKAKEDFAFNDGLAISNMPRLKTGSVATYIVPTTVQKAGTEYKLTYKGQAAGTFTGSAVKPDMTEARQVTNDTFEVEALKANGVVDYGYVIAAYSGGRGANAFVLDENNKDENGNTYQIISSGQAREVTITPEGGQPMIAKYVPFTQSTDGKQEPKFRLPAGETLKPGVKYIVASDWAQIANPTFVAKDIASLQITGAEAVNETSINVVLAADPGDELFSGRSVQLTDESGNKLTATYRFSSRKGATGVFDLAAESKLTTGTVYTVTPVGDWAGQSKVELKL